MKILKKFVLTLNQIKFRITGSVCYGIYTYTRNKTPDWKKQVKKLFEPASFTSEYTEYGKNTEKDAREAFPWLAYSPDGIIISNGVPSALLEIKCPFKERRKYIYKRKAYILVTNSTWNVKKTFFVFYSSFDKKLFVITVDFNEEYTKKMLEALKKAYFEKMLHEICLIKRNPLNA
ncbi:hypothetical protein ABEB36_015127 [Hypothenemus hampei]|uniref:YqaJ viral recombinase domain-containing protein n=1 Tax=Hypothenemus hampei TaxID=57062 RepID=A0ABD1E0J4_HYPHA